MSPKKRRQSSELNSPRIAKKRATIQSTSGLPKNSQEPYYRIRDIIGEKPGLYLIDWEDDPITGQKYRPDWQPKRNANAEAVAAWIQRKAGGTKGGTRRTRPRRRKLVSLKLRPSTSDAFSLPATSEHQIPEQASPAASSPLVPELQEEQENLERSAIEVDDSQQSVLPPIAAPDSPRIAVEISQHNSFPREEYPLYQASISTQVVSSSSQPHHLDSGLGNPSSPPGHIEPTAIDKDLVIPDSQAPLDSSTITPSNKSTETLHAVDAIDAAKSDRSFSDNTRNHHLRPLKFSSILASNPAKGSSSFVPLEACEIGNHSRRRNSSPARISSGTFSIEGKTSIQSSRAKTESLLCSPNSDKQADFGIANPLLRITQRNQIADGLADLLYSNSAARGSATFQQSGQIVAGLEAPEISSTVPEAVELLSTSCNSLDSQRVPTSIISESDIIFQTQVPLTQVFPTSKSPDHWHSHPQIPVETEESSRLGSNGGEVNEQVEVFQTQLPLLTESQDTYQIETATSTSGEIWQGGQASQRNSQSSSEVSADDKIQTFVPHASPSHLKPENIGSPNRSSRLSSPNGSLIPLADIDPRISSEIYVLNQIDPNSQPGKQLSIKEETVLPTVETLDFVAENASSSLAPIAPSQLPETFATGTPPRPTTSSQVEMAEAPQIATMSRGQTTSLPHNIPKPLPEQELSLTQKLRNMRAASAATTAARKARNSSISARSKSPSIIPDKASPQNPDEDRLEVQALETPMVVRASQNNRHVPTQRSKLAHHKEMSQMDERSQLHIITSLGEAQLGRMEFVVPLPMNSSIRDIYVAAIHQHRELIEAFVREEHPEIELRQQMKAMIQRIDNISVHVDLEYDDHMASQDALPEDEASWAETRSAKFQFLKHLFESLRHQDQNVVIIAQAGRSLDILETYLIGKHMAYTRQDGQCAKPPQSPGRGELRISLMTTENEVSVPIASRADIIVAFDSSFNPRAKHVEILRSRTLNTRQLCPVVHLVVYSSAEHIKRCLPPASSEVNALRALVSCVAQTRHSVGMLLPDEYTPSAAAEEVAEFMKAGALEDHWTLPAIRTIEGIELAEPTQDTGSPMPSEVQLDTSRQDPMPVVDLKRSLDDSDSSDNTQKRQRVAPGMEVTHVSDTVTEESQVGSQTIADLRCALQNAEETVSALKSNHDARETSWQRNIDATQQRLQEHFEALGELQTRFEAQTNSLHALRHENAELKINAVATERKREAQDAEANVLKNYRTKLQASLEEAQGHLRGSENPEIAEMERLRQEVRDLSADRSALEKKIENLSRDFEFTRQQYQSASTAAAESISRVSMLESSNARLQQKASGMAVQLHAANNRSENESHLQRVVYLENLLRDREDLLRKKEEELREIRRGRGMGGSTRASSQARSPKGGSRAGSPASTILGIGTGAKVLGSALRYG